MWHRRPKPIIFCSNDNPGLNLTFLRQVKILEIRHLFIWENVTMMDSLEIIESCDLDFGLYGKLYD